MFGKRFELFTLFGFAVRIDLSWFVLAILITWSLATGYFPTVYEQLLPTSYWIMGAVAALGMFISVVLHELAHSFVARRHGVQMKGITLFIFGGVAEMTEEPPSPKAEFQVAIAGPIASVLISAVCYCLYLLARIGGLGLGVVGVLGYLAMINLVLVVFNMIPAFPLDGGRVLRSVLWQAKGSLRKATRTTSRLGATFGTVLVLLGLLSVITGNFVGGMWWFLIGLFLRGAAQMSYQQLLLRQVLEGEPVRRFMHAAPVAVPRSISVEELVDQYVYRHHFKMFPVVDNGELVGCVSTRDIKELPREEWARSSVTAIMKRCGEENTVAADDDAMKALARMNQTRASRLMVVEEGRLIGVLALKDLLDFFALKLELNDLG